MTVETGKKEKSGRPKFGTVSAKEFTVQLEVAD
jgi:hypothetical protein